MNELKMEARNVSLETLVEQLAKLRERRVDIIAPTKSIRYHKNRPTVVVSDMPDAMDELRDMGIAVRRGKTEFALSDFAHRQLDTKMGIPTAYGEKLRTTHPELYHKNVNGWLDKFAAEQPNKSLFLRGLRDDDGNVYGRAVLSDRYMPFDNFEFLAAALDEIGKMRERHGYDVQIASCNLTERNMVVNFVVPDVREQAMDVLENYKRPDGKPDAFGGGILAGFTLRNSEIGANAISIAPRALVGKCANGLVFWADAVKRQHMGTTMERGAIVWSQRTMTTHGELVKQQIGDAVATFVSPDYLGKTMAHIRAMDGVELRHPIDAVRNASQMFGMSDDECNDVFTAWMKQGTTNGTVWDLAQSLTFAVQTMDAETQFDVERRVFDLARMVDQYDVPSARFARRNVRFTEIEE